MKKITTIILLVFFASACKESNRTLEVENNTTEASKNTSTTNLPTTKEKYQSTAQYLCKINDQDWSYTKASGIVSTHAKTKKQIALITFKKKLPKGSESIQLHYETNSLKLIAVSLILKFPKKEGGLFTCYYDLHPDTRKRNPQSEISGSIDLSDATRASGTAEIKNLNIKYEKEKLKNVDDAVISISDLKFSNVGYSDIDKFVKTYKK